MHTRGKHYSRNLAKRNAAKRRELLRAIDMNEFGEFDGIVVSDRRGSRCDEIPEGYRGLVLHVNDHGNITLLKSFKNGNTHEVWGMV